MMMFAMILYILEKDLLPHILRWKNRNEGTFHIRFMNRNNKNWNSAYSALSLILDSADQNKFEKYLKDGKFEEKSKRRCTANIKRFMSGSDPYFTEIKACKDVGTIKIYKLTFPVTNISAMLEKLTEDQKKNIHERAKMAKGKLKPRHSTPSSHCLCLSKKALDSSESFSTISCPPSETSTSSSFEIQKEVEVLTDISDNQRANRNDAFNTSFSAASGLCYPGLYGSQDVPLCNQEVNRCDAFNTSFCAGSGQSNPDTFGNQVVPACNQDICNSDFHTSSSDNLTLDFLESLNAPSIGNLAPIVTEPLNMNCDSLDASRSPFIDGVEADCTLNELNGTITDSESFDFGEEINEREESYDLNDLLYSDEE